MPKTKKKVAKATKKTVKKSPARKTAPKKVATVMVSSKKNTTTFSQEFTNALLVIFGAGMVLFAYVIFRVYG